MLLKVQSLTRLQGNVKADGPWENFRPAKQKCFSRKVLNNIQPKTLNAKMTFKGKFDVREIDHNITSQSREGREYMFNLYLPSWQT